MFQRRAIAGVLCASLAVCAMTVLWAVPGPQGAGPVQTPRAGRFHAATGGHMISVPVLVTDSRGRFMDVNPDAFELSEDKVPQRVTRVDFQEAPLDVSFALDISSSMEKVFPTLRTAGNDFLSSIREPDLVRLLTFGERVTDVPRGKSWSTALDDVMPRGATPLRDDMLAALDRYMPLVARRSLVVISDGQTDKSRASIDTFSEALRVTDVVLYLMVLAPDRNARDARDAWDRVTAASGGRTIRPELRNVTAELKTVRAELPQFRVLTYHCPREAADGAAHTIEVQVRGRKDLRVRARTAHIDAR